MQAFPISNLDPEPGSDPPKVVKHKQHPLIYIRLMTGCSLEMQGMGASQFPKQAALQICSASEPSDQGFPRNPLLINIRHPSSVWRASSRWSQQRRTYLQTSVDSSWWDQRIPCVLLPMGKAVSTLGDETTFQPNKARTIKMETDINVTKSPPYPEGPF